MSENINPSESGIPERTAFQHQEMVEYNDGEVDLSFSHVGDTVAWGKHKYANPELFDMVLVRTKSGNAYILGDGMIINTDTRGVFDMDAMPDRLPDITIGKPWEVPGVTSTTDIKEVLLRWKIAPGMGEKVVDKPSPFVAVGKWLEAARVALDAKAGN